MRNSSACGDDGVSIRLLKLCFDAIGDVILFIVNSCLAASDFPDIWKHSLVFPIFKSGDPTNPSNFRPISIIPAIAKLVERVVHRQLYGYLSTNHLLSETQHGFRPRHSTETALVSVSDHILSAIDRGDVSLLCLVDLSKCFDVIDHSVLIDKLELHSVCSSWFQSYLRGHTQSVSFADASGKMLTSRPLENNMGVFQGSALGPLLFSVFANDLSLFALDAMCCQYADDTQLLVTGPKSSLSVIISRLESALSSLDQWFRANGLKVNADKTQVIAFGSRQSLRSLPQFVVKFGASTILPSTEVKNLGLTFDSQLSWDSHISLLSRRCCGILSGLSHVRHYLPFSAVKVLTTALVLSQVRYCISVYGNGTKQNLERVEKILNFAARVVYGRRKYDHVSNLKRQLGWMSSDDMVQYHTLSLLHKTISYGEPEALASEFQLNSSRRSRVTRQDNLLHVPRSRTAAGKRRFCARAPAQFNALPVELTALPVSGFASSLKAHLRSVRHCD